MTDPLPADRSRAVLIGCSTYRHLTDLPAVANNVTDLAAALSDPDLWGLPAANCTVVSGDVSLPVAFDAVRNGAREVGADGLLLIYYAGHGMIDSDNGRLHLAVTDSEFGEEDATAVAYESIRRRVWQSPAAHKLVILDCCYAARALVGEMSAADLSEDIEIDQSVIIAAASRNDVALARPGARNTAFTGALLTVINKGVTNGPPVLDARTIYREVLRAQTKDRLPRPEFRSRNAADDLPVVRNAWQPPPRRPPITNRRPAEAHVPPAANRRADSRSPVPSVQLTRPASDAVRVFISYAHEDAASDDQVRELWLLLRSLGIDAKLDRPAAEEPKDWTLWMLDQIREARYVLVVASPRYHERSEGRAEPGDGRGVQFEAALIREEFYRDRTAGRAKFLPVVLPGRSPDDIPAFLGPTSATHYRIAELSADGVDRLYRVLTGQPWETEPPPGPLWLRDPRPTKLSGAATEPSHAAAEAGRAIGSSTSKLPQRPAPKPVAPAPVKYGSALLGVGAAVVVMAGAAFAASNLFTNQSRSPATTSSGPAATSSAPLTAGCTGGQYSGWTATGKELTITVGPFGTRYRETDKLTTTVAVHNNGDTDIANLTLTAYDEKNHKIATKGWTGRYGKKATTNVELQILPKNAVRGLRLEFSRAGERMSCTGQVASPQPSPKPTSITGSWGKSGSGMRLTAERVSFKTVEAMPDTGKPGMEIAFAFKNAQANDIVAVEIEVSDQSGYVLYRSGLPVFQNIGSGQTRRALVEFPVSGDPKSLMVSYSGVRSGTFGGPTSTFTFPVPVPGGA